MNARQLLDDLHARGIELQAHGDRLRWRPVQALTDTDRQALSMHKAGLLAILTQAAAVTITRTVLVCAPKPFAIVPAVPVKATF